MPPVQIAIAMNKKHSIYICVGEMLFAEYIKRVETSGNRRPNNGKLEKILKITNSSMSLINYKSKLHLLGIQCKYLFLKK